MIVLLRYAVLWLYGGVYIDDDSDIRTPLDKVHKPSHAHTFSWSISPPPPPPVALDSVIYHLLPINTPSYPHRTLHQTNKPFWTVVITTRWWSPWTLSSYPASATASTGTDASCPDTTFRTHIPSKRTQTTTTTHRLRRRQQQSRRQHRRQQDRGQVNRRSMYSTDG